MKRYIFIKNVRPANLHSDLVDLVKKFGLPTD